MKQYNFKGLAGCVSQRRAHQTGTRVGIYHSVQAGMEDDPFTPWMTVCEIHHICVGHPSLRMARFHAADPAGWCEECRHQMEERDVADPGS